MLKKFLNDESKSPVKDFLLWLVVYPFMIAFAVACAINIFQFSVFQNIKFTDWVMAGCTVGVLIGTWKAASYARKAAHQAQIQNNHVFVNKMDDLRGALEPNLNVIRGRLFFIKKTCHTFQYDPGSIPNDGFETLLDELYEATEAVLNPKNSENIYKYELFIRNIINSSYFDELDKLRPHMRIYMEHIYKYSVKPFQNLEKYVDSYLKLIEQLLDCINLKYKELNGCSERHKKR